MIKEKAQFKVVPIPHTTPEIFWVYNCTCGAHYQGVYDQLKYGKNKLPMENCDNCGNEVKEIILKSIKDTEVEKRGASAFDILQITILIILLMICFIYLFRDYIHIPLDID